MPASMRRVSVVGNAGSGKTTLGRAIAVHLGVPVLELDSIRHQAGWVELPDPEFRRLVSAFTDRDGWVVDGNYGAVREDIVWSRADTIVWVDPPRWRAAVQIVRRSVLRVVLRRELWNGNRERVRNLLSLDPTESIILWAWRNHGRNRERYEAAFADPRWAHLDRRRLRSRRDVRRLLASLST